MKHHDIYVLIDWSEELHQITVINESLVVPLSRMCELTNLDEPEELDFDYYLALDKRDRIFGLVSVAKELAEEEIALGKDKGSTVMEFSYKQWGCTKLLHWSHKQVWWDHTYDEDKLASKGEQDG